LRIKKNVNNEDSSRTLVTECETLYASIVSEYIEAFIWPLWTAPRRRQAEIPQ